MVSDGNGESTVVGLMFGVICCRVPSVFDGYGECTVVGLLFGVMWCRVTSVL